MITRTALLYLSRQNGLKDLLTRFDASGGSPAGSSPARTSTTPWPPSATSRGRDHGLLRPTSARASPRRPRPSRKSRVLARPRPDRRRGDQFERLGQADAARARHRRRALLPQRAPHRRGGRAPIEFRAPRHGGHPEDRRHAARLPPLARGVRPGRRRHPVLPLPERGRRRGTAPARGAHPALQGRLRRAATAAFPEKRDVDTNFVKLMRQLLKSGIYQGSRRTTRR